MASDRARRANELLDTILKRVVLRREDEDDVQKLRNLISLIPAKPKLDPVKGRPWG